MRGVSVSLFFLLLIVSSSYGANYPVKANSGGRYLVDAKGQPFLVMADAPHSILANLNQANQVAYLNARNTNGYNSLWIELLCDSYTFGFGAEGTANYGKDYAGNNPFTSTLAGGYYDLSTPNAAYWANVDWTILAAGSNGLQCIFVPLDQGGWTTTSIVNGTNKCFAYGQFLGNRYKGFTNIFWNLGNDFQLWNTLTNDIVILAIANGIHSVDTNHSMTIQLDFWSSYSLQDSRWDSLLDVNGVYEYYSPYGLTYRAYNSSNAPVLFLESNYENENNSGQQLGTPYALRLQQYWTILAGALGGYMSGNAATDRFTNGWPNQLGSTGDKMFKYWHRLFTSRAYQNLVPDQLHKLVSAGYGTSNNMALNLTTVDYATAALTPDKTLGIVYTPQAHTLTVQMTNFAGPVTSRWFDPSADTFVNITGTPFANTISTNLTTPGNNAAGQGDWVLLLESGAHTYYVDTTNGNDSADGSLATPWKTIAQATATVAPGDTVIIQPGIYNEYVTLTNSGTSGSPITFTGVRGAAGEWLTIIDPSTAVSGWAAAGEIGGGCYKITNSFAVSELTIGNKRVMGLASVGDLSGTASQAYSTGPTTGAGFLSLGTAATETTLFNNNQVVTWWDGIEALWGASGTTTYLRMRDGSAPSGVRVEAGGSAIGFNGQSFCIISNLAVRGAKNQVYLSGAGAHDNIVVSNRLTTGYSRVTIQTAAANNQVLFNSDTTDYYGYTNMGAWAFGSGTTVGQRLNIYLVSKYLWGAVQVSSYDYDIAIGNPDGQSAQGAGGTNVISGNTISQSTGVGIVLAGNNTATCWGTIISSNNISGCPSVGIHTTEGASATKIFGNYISDCDANIRYHHFGSSTETNRTVWVYRNRSWLPDASSATGLAGQHIFIHCQGSTFKPTYLTYFNSFSGGQCSMTDNGTTLISGQKAVNITTVNNIFSDGFFYYSEDTQWTNANWMGLFDYNLTTPPLRNYPSGVNYPAWFGSHNIKSATNQWVSVQGMSFALMTNSQAIDAAVDVSTNWIGGAALPDNGQVKTGSAWDMGALEFGGSSPTPPIAGGVLSVGTAVLWKQ